MHARESTTDRDSITNKSLFRSYSTRECDNKVLVKIGHPDSAASKLKLSTYGCSTFSTKFFVLIWQHQFGISKIKAYTYVPKCSLFNTKKKVLYTCHIDLDYFELKIAKAVEGGIL